MTFQNTAFMNMVEKATEQKYGAKKIGATDELKCFQTKPRPKI